MNTPTTKIELNDEALVAVAGGGRKARRQQRRADRKARRQAVKASRKGSGFLVRAMDIGFDIWANTPFGKLNRAAGGPVDYWMTGGRVDTVNYW